MVYAWNENFILPLSHDEVVHGKGSLLAKMPGDRWQQLANLRALYAYMWAHPGKKLLFMGQELGTPWEWDDSGEVPWWLLDHAEHSGVQSLVRDLNRLYRGERALWEVDFSPDGFRWLEPNDAANNVFAFARLSVDDRSTVVCIANLSPVPQHGYRVGLPAPGAWREALNTDSEFYGGSGVGSMGTVTSEERPWHDQPFSAEVTLPPLGVVWLVPERAAA
jgi:1,4-alpha-glucan branching enzyme